jgi:hypothetical protein
MGEGGDANRSRLGGLTWLSRNPFLFYFIWYKTFGELIRNLNGLMKTYSFMQTQVGFVQWIGFLFSIPFIFLVFIFYLIL